MRYTLELMFIGWGLALLELAYILLQNKNIDKLKTQLKRAEKAIAGYVKVADDFMSVKE